MAKIKVAGQAVVVTSSLKLEDIKLVKKYRPQALVLKGGEDKKEEIFRIDACDAGSINKYGAAFNDVTRDEAKLARLTLTTNYSGDNVQEFIADELGEAIAHLKALEAALPEVVESIKAERKALVDSITVE